ncbi:MAG: pyridoxine 5'-phosphate synthase [Spirochaetales bacterium]|jgi:pyridoxine 5-phosphate synthase|nr:pyridoxine 5'-phosphate synthase [Spirochaetales bacterium]
MTKLSVNINKIATLRNARGGNNPDVQKTAADIERFGAQGITVHPRPDERHIRYEDVRILRPTIKTEFNIEGYPSESFVDLVLQAVPNQVTLVPDPPDAITSSEGWDTISNAAFLKEVISRFKNAGIRTSIFIDTNSDLIRGAKAVGADRVELYTEPYAREFPDNPKTAIQAYVKAAELARELGLGLNAGHDLDLNNLKYFVTAIPWIDEVSIGHALICDALYYGLENTVGMYLRALE